MKGGSESEMSSSTIASLEFAEVKQERDNFKEDLQAVKFELANTRSEFQASATKMIPVVIIFASLKLS